jgi:hypothetical protein
MNIPGFTAEASLCKSTDYYRETAFRSQVHLQEIVLQLRDGPRCQPDGQGRICCYDPYRGYYCFRIHGFPE